MIQAYLRDSERDLHAIVYWAKTRNQRVKIRLVKGAYWDAEIGLGRAEKLAFARFPVQARDRREL